MAQMGERRWAALPWRAVHGDGAKMATTNHGDDLMANLTSY